MVIWIHRACCIATQAMSVALKWHHTTKLLKLKVSKILCIPNLREPYVRVNYDSENHREPVNGAREWEGVKDKESSLPRCDTARARPPFLLKILIAKDLLLKLLFHNLFQNTEHTVTLIIETRLF